MVAGHVIGLRRSGAAVKLSNKGWFSGQKRKHIKPMACVSGNLGRKCFPCAARASLLFGTFILMSNVGRSQWAAKLRRALGHHFNMRQLDSSVQCFRIS
jgi:hypothetical protein